MVWEDLTSQCLVPHHLTIIIIFDFQVIISDESGSKVVLKNLSRRDAGLYICTADNQVNEGVEKITKITVKCKLIYLMHFP